MTIEAKDGVPTVAMHTDKFTQVVRSVAAVNGIPGLRQVFVPQPVKADGRLREVTESPMRSIKEGDR